MSVVKDIFKALMTAICLTIGSTLALCLIGVALKITFIFYAYLNLQ